LGIWPHTYLANGLLASPGALVVMQGTVTRIPTIVPAMASYGRAGKRCVFLNADGTCKVHPVAPFGCAYFDDHMSAEEGDRRSKAALLSILHSASYQRLWRLLWQDGRRSLPPEQKRKDIPCPAGK
jgi:Fe-S-cluster containining protein